MSATVKQAAAEVGPPKRHVAAATRDQVNLTTRDTATGAPGTGRRIRHPNHVALAAGALGSLAIATDGSMPNGVVSGGLAAVLVVVAATDIQHRIIPNRIVLPATAAVLLARVVLSHGSAGYVLAALVAGAFFVLPALFGRQWMGMGDVKLVVLLGAGLGWDVVDAVMIAFLAVFPFAVGTLVRGGLAARKTSLPLGPFLAFGALVVLLVPGLFGAGGS